MALTTTVPVTAEDLLHLPARITFGTWASNWTLFSLEGRQRERERSERVRKRGGVDEQNNSNMNTQAGQSEQLGMVSKKGWEALIWVKYNHNMIMFYIKVGVRVQAIIWYITKTARACLQSEISMLLSSFITMSTIAHQGAILYTASIKKSQVVLDQ